MSNNKIFKSNKGFTLLEVLVAIFIIAVGIGGVATIMPSLVSGMSLSQSRLIAAYLAQEGIETVRNIRDTNWLEEHNRDEASPPIAWDDGLTGCTLAAGGCQADYDDLALVAFGLGSYLNTENLSGFYGYGAGIATKYKRKITIEPDGDILTITIDVFWQDKGKDYNFPVQERIYKWY